MTDRHVSVVFPRDSWSALALALLASRLAHQEAAAGEQEMGSSLARYASEELALQRSLSCSTTGVVSGPLSRTRVVRLGMDPARGTLVCVALPLPGCLFYDGTRRWAQFAQWEAVRRYVALCRIAEVQTIGGGWASLRQADKALACAMELYALGSFVGDGDIVSKCRVFIGWAHLWSGLRETAVHLFELELKDALRRDDMVHQRRCVHALINARTNPTLNGERGGPARHFSLTDCWTKAFSGVDVSPT